MDQPNIILLMTDQHRKDSVGCYGNKIVKTPHLDSIAADGMRFENCICQTPLCLPSRASLLTGMYPSVHGAKTNQDFLNDALPTYARALSGQGYETVHLGKLNVLPLNAPSPEHRAYPPFGFDRLVVTDEPMVFDDPYWAWVKKKAPEHLEKIRMPFAADRDPQSPYILDFPIQYHPNNWLTGEVIDFLRRDHPHPFFLAVSFFDPHFPFNPPKAFADLYNPAEMPLPLVFSDELEDKPPYFKEIQKKYRGMTEENLQTIKAYYYAMISHVDDCVGRMLTAFKDHGLVQNTALFFTSDHGEFLGDHGFLGKGGVHYDCTLQVPLMAKWPGRFPAGLSTTALVELTDLTAVFLELAGAKPYPGMQARSFLPVLRGETAEHREFTVTEEVIPQEGGVCSRTIRTDRYKMTYYNRSDRGFLIDLQKDPNERHNLFGKPEHRDIQADLIEKIVDWDRECENSRAALKNLPPSWLRRLL